MRIPLVIALIGEAIFYFAAVFVPPLILAVANGEGAIVWGFALASFISLTIGLFARHGALHRREMRLHRKEALATVSLSWLSFGLLSAIPYLFDGLRPSDAFFEAISGLSATGATILTDFGSHGQAFFLWRAMTQWLGGLGIIAVFVVVLPRLGIAGRQLFFSETSNAGEALRFQVRNAAKRLWILYSVLTGLCFVALLFCGLPAFDALCHALTTLSAGGFSVSGQSVAAYGSASVEWVLLVFMTLAGCSFTLLYRSLATERGAALRDREFLVYVSAVILLGVAAGLTLDGGFSLANLRTGLFQTASLSSSTGFASDDFALWSDRTKVFLVLAMLMGGCAGSAGGGPKVVRLLIFGKYVAQSITRTLHPDAILPYKWVGRVIPGRVMRSIIALVVLYFTGYVVIALLIVLLGVPLEDAFFVAIACLGNIGPAFGEAGPMGSYAGFSDAVKVVLTGAMWVGRLEIVTVLVMLHPEFLKNTRWSSR